MTPGFAKQFSELLPKRFRETRLRRALGYAGIEEDPSEWLGKRVLRAFLLGLLAAALVYGLYRFLGILYLPEYEFPVSLPFGEPPLFFVVPVVPLLAVLLAFVLTAAGLLLLSYLNLYYLIEGRAQVVDGILPDFLLLVSSNINAGMTPFSAFRAAARPEFGPLAEEAKYAVAKSLGTTSFHQALLELSARIRSDSLKDVVAFFSQAMKAGGKLSKLIESSAFDIRQTQELKKELQSSTKMYVLFVAFIVMIATPLLMAVSVQFLDMVNKIQSSTRVSFLGDTGLGFLATSSELSSGFMANTALVLLFGNALLASFFIGILASGKGKLGLKYFPAILIVSFLAFLASRAFLRVLLP